MYIFTVINTNTETDTSILLKVMDGSVHMDFGGLGN